MRTVRIIIIESSALYRSQITSALNGIHGIHVAANVSTVSEGLAEIQKNMVDLIILDSELLERDTDQVLLSLQKANPKGKVLLFSSYTQVGAQLTLEAISNGADGFVIKPEKWSAHQTTEEVLKNLFEPKLDALFADRNEFGPLFPERRASATVAKFSPHAVAIGSGCEGLRDVEDIICGVTEIHPPTFFSQSMPPLFVEELAKRWARLSRLRVCIAQDGEPVERGTLYITPGDSYMELERSHLTVCIKVRPIRGGSFSDAAIDSLFLSFATVYGENGLALVMSGMGKDGVLGAMSVSRVGGKVVLQSGGISTCMELPKVVSTFDVGDASLSPMQIRDWLMSTTIIKQAPSA